MCGDNKSVGEQLPESSIAAGGSASYVYLCLSVLQFMYNIGDFFRFMFGSWRELANIRLKNEMHERAVG